MKGVRFSEANDVLRGGPAKKYGTDQDVYDLPIHRSSSGVISCWRPSSFREWLRLVVRARVYFWCWGETHPPVVLTAEYPFARRQKNAE